MYINFSISARVSTSCIFINRNSHGGASGKSVAMYSVAQSKVSLSRDNYHRRTLAGRVRRIYSCIHGKMIASLMSRSACTRCVTLYIFSLYLCIARHARNSSNSRRALASDKNIARARRVVTDERELGTSYL